MSSRPDFPLALALALCGLGGAILLWFGIWWYQQFGLGWDLQTHVITGSELTIQRGQGQATKEGLLMVKPTPEREIIALAPLPSVETDKAWRISWKLVDLSPRQELYLVWISSRKPKDLRVRRLNEEDMAAGYLTMEEDPDWKGQITQLGIMIKGALDKPVLVTSISIARELLTPLEAIQDQIDDWIHQEPWSGRSINFHEGTLARHWLTPITAIALWIALSGILYLYLRARRFPATKLPLMTGLALLVLAGWFLLDLRWQWELATRLRDTFHHYVRQPEDDGHRQTPDERVLQAAQSIREALPPGPVRLLILSEDPQGYFSQRLRYHLLPHRSFGTNLLPEQQQVKAGDYIALLSHLGKIRYIAASRELVSATTTLAVEPLVKTGSLSLFRVSGKSP